MSVDDSTAVPPVVVDEHGVIHLDVGYAVRSLDRMSALGTAGDAPNVQLWASELDAALACAQANKQRGQRVYEVVKLVMVPVHGLQPQQEQGVLSVLDRLLREVYEIPPAEPATWTDPTTPSNVVRLRPPKP